MENSSEERIICILSVDLDITNNYLAVILYLFPKKLNSTLVTGLIRTRLRGKYKKREASKRARTRLFRDTALH